MTALAMVLVVFTTPLGREQREIVKYNHVEDLAPWIAQYKRDYCPTATHRVGNVGAVKLSDNINVA